MTQQLTEKVPEALDELGPVDWIVVEFPGSRFKGEIAPILDDLVERGTVRVLDLLLIRKDEVGELEFFELSDLDESEIGSLRAYETELATLLSEDDVNAVADAQKLEHAAVALVNRDLIGQAKGILMERFKITAAQAFEVLAKVSQDTNRKLYAVADDLTRTGTLGR